MATEDEAAGYAELVRIGPEESGTTAVSEIGHVVIDERAIDHLFGAI